MASLDLKAFAKINIGLNIIKKREDGYHNIETVFQLIDLHDQIEISNRSDSKIVIRCNAHNVPEDQNNICYKAALLIKEFTNISDGVTITINKRIPVGAGLGGGSSDAAATLRGLARLWRLAADENTLQKVALTLGADVPFFLSGRTSLATGIGEKLTSVTLPTDYFIVLVYPNIEISTAWAYKNFNFSLTRTKKIIKLSQILLKKINKFEWQYFLQNDFEDIVFKEFPELRGIKKKLYQQGAFYASLSGSGSALFGMFKTILEAEEAAENVLKSYQTILARPL